jgi:hypothetical protein
MINAEVAIMMNYAVIAQFEHVCRDILRLGWRQLLTAYSLRRQIHGFYAEALNHGNFHLTGR